MGVCLGRDLRLREKGHTKSRASHSRGHKAKSQDSPGLSRRIASRPQSEFQVREDYRTRAPGSKKNQKPQKLRSKHFWKPECRLGWRGWGRGSKLQSIWERPGVDHASGVLDSLYKKESIRELLQKINWMGRPCSGSICSHLLEPALCRDDCRETWEAI